MNFILHIRSKCGQGEGGKKSETFADVINECSQRIILPLREHPLMTSAKFSDFLTPSPLSAFGTAL